MSQKKLVQFSIVNVILREHLMNFAQNLLISKRIVSHHKLDQLEFHHKAELHFMKTLITMAKKLHTPKINLVSKILIFH